MTLGIGNTRNSTYGIGYIVHMWLSHKSIDIQSNQNANSPVRAWLGMMCTIVSQIYGAPRDVKGVHHGEESRSLTLYSTYENLSSSALRRK